MGASESKTQKDKKEEKEEKIVISKEKLDEITEGK